MNNTPRTLPLPKCLHDINEKNKQNHFTTIKKYSNIGEKSEIQKSSTLSNETIISTYISINTYSTNPEKSLDIKRIGTFSTDISEKIRDKYKIPVAEPKNSNNLKLLDMKYKLLTEKITESKIPISIIKSQKTDELSIIPYLQIEEKKDSNDLTSKKLPAKQIKSALNAYLEKFRHLVFGFDVPDKKFFKHALLINNGLVYASKSLKPPSNNFLESRKINFPKKKLSLIATILIIKVLIASNLMLNKTLVLDLDETLISSSSSLMNVDKIIRIESNGGFQIVIIL